MSAAPDGKRRCTARYWAVMSKENLELVRRGYRDFNKHGLAALRGYLAHDVVWETPRDVPESGTYRGLDAVMTYIKGLSAAFDEVRLEPGEVLPAGDYQVLVALQLRARSHDGSLIEMPWFHLWTLNEGKVSAVRSFLRREEALDAAGLSE